MRGTAAALIALILMKVVPNSPLLASSSMQTKGRAVVLFLRQGLLGWGGRMQDFLFPMWPGKYFLRCLTSCMLFELNRHQWQDWAFQGQPCSCLLFWLVPFLPSVYFTLCRKWFHRSATITLALSKKEISLKLAAAFPDVIRGLWHSFVIADKKWIIYSYHSQMAKLFLTSQRNCPLFSLSLYLAWHFKEAFPNGCL